MPVYSTLALPKVEAEYMSYVEEEVHIPLMNSAMGWRVFFRLPGCHAALIVKEQRTAIVYRVYNLT